MDKYRMFDKVIKTKPVTFYRAEVIANRQSVLVKKIQRSITWQQILKSKQLTLSKSAKNKYLANIRQVVKDEDKFYIIMEALQENLEIVIKSEISKEDILKISKNLILLAKNFKQNGILPKQLRPAYLFLSNERNTLKLAHLQTQIQKSISSLDMVQLQDLKYLSPEQVLTSKEVDDRSLVFSIGLIIAQLITGKALFNANTKMSYMYQICKLFPGQNVNLQQSAVNPTEKNDQSKSQNFHQLMSKQNLSNQFIALLYEMLKIDRSQRLDFESLVEAFDLVAENQLNFQKNQLKGQYHSKYMNKPNNSQTDINSQILHEIDFQFEVKSTLSNLPNFKNLTKPLPIQKNIEDDSVQPILIKQSSKPLQGKSIQQTKESSKNSRSIANNPTSFTTIRRPQLTNYALNETNLGVQVGLNPTLFSDADF